MDHSRTPARSARAGPVLAVARALLGLLLVGVGAAALMEVLVELLDDDIMWPALILGTLGCVAGVVVFLRASEPWARDAVAAPAGRIGGAARIVAAGGSIVLGIGTAAVAAVWIGGVLADGAFEKACAGFEGIMCLIKSQVGGATAGLMLGIRGAQAVLRARWAVLLFLVTIAALEGVVLVAQQTTT